MVLRLAALLALALLGACASPRRALELWDDVRVAYEAGDADAAAALFAEDARWWEADVLQHEGRAAIRARVAFEIGLGTRRSPAGDREYRAGDGGRTWQTTHSDLREVLGLPPGERSWVVAGRDGQLGLVRLLHDPAPDPADAASVDAFLEWVRTERPGEWGDLAPSGAPTLSRTVGERLVALAREYMASGATPARAR